MVVACLQCRVTFNKESFHTKEHSVDVSQVPLSSGTTQHTAQTPTGVYLIMGPDRFKQAFYLNYFRTYFKNQQQTPCCHAIERFDASETAVKDVVACCASFSLFSSLRLIECHNVDAYKKSDIDALLNYCKQASPSSVLLLVSSSMMSSSRLCKTLLALDTKRVMSCPALSKKELVSWIATRTHAHGLECSASVCNAIMDACGTDTAHIDSEISRIALSTSTKQFHDVADIAPFLPQIDDSGWWICTDALMQRNTARALAYVRAHPESVFNLLQRIQEHLEKLLYIHHCTNTHTTPKLTEQFGGSSWQYRSYPRFAQNFTTGELAHLYVRSCELDEVMKSGKNPVYSFMLFVLLFKAG